MITKAELEKLKEVAGKYSEIMGICNERFDVSNYAICAKIETQYNYAANPDTVLRLIEALEVATEALKRHYVIECIYCVGDGTTEDAPDFQNAYGEHGLHTKACLLCRPAKEALNKIYGKTK